MSNYDEPHGPEFVRGFRMGDEITPMVTNTAAFVEGAREFLDLIEQEGNAYEGALKTQAKKIKEQARVLREIREALTGIEQTPDYPANVPQLIALLLKNIDEVLDADTES